jgi:hypothetical protein
MGELRELVGVHGAVDRAVAADPDRRADVARLLPIYRNPDARWFDEFEAWTLERMEGEPEEPPFPRSIDEALEGLATYQTPPPRYRARRLFATALAVRAFPERLRRDGDLVPIMLSVLEVEGLARDDEAALELLELLGDNSLLPPDENSEALDEWWANVVDRASEGLIGDTRADIGPRPCTGKLVPVTNPDGSTVPAAALKTIWETDAIDFAHAIKFLEPSNWPRCSGFWCEMVKVADKPAGVRHYHEVVSTDCDHKAWAWTVSAELDFRFYKSQREASVDYVLAEGHPVPGDDVVVDEGSLTVEDVGAAIRVETTKRVRFSHAFSGESLALIMCALGYADIVAEFVFNCAALGRRPKTRFPDEAGEDTAGHGGDHPGDSVIDDITEDAVAAVKACIDDWAEAAKGSIAKAADGHYTADAAVQDMVCTTARLVRHGAAAVDVGLRAAARTRRGGA